MLRGGARVMVRGGARVMVRGGARVKVGGGARVMLRIRHTVPGKSLGWATGDGRCSQGEPIVSKA